MAGDEQLGVRVNDIQELTLKPLHPELEGDIPFGPEVEDKGLVARLAVRPLPVPLDALPGLAADSPLAKHLAHPMFRIWVVPHSFGVVRRGGLREPTSASLEVQYLSEGRTCSIQGLLPSPEFVKLGETSFDCSLLASGRLASNDGPFDATSVQHVAGLEARASASAGGSLRFRASVALPAVSAIGLGGDHAEWCFGELGSGVLGRDTSCWTFLVLPRSQRELRMKARLRVTHRLAFFSARMDTDWVEMTASLTQ